MAAKSKVVRIPIKETLTPELRAFLDAVIVPALLNKFFAESENSCTPKLQVGILPARGAGAVDDP
jgi:hypothetical protein